MDETAGVGFEGVSRFGEVEPFAEDGMRRERREIRA